jgi:hypothetical protein
MPIMLDGISSSVTLVSLPVLGLVAYTVYAKTRPLVGVETTRLRGPPRQVYHPHIDVSKD